MVGQSYGHRRTPANLLTRYLACDGLCDALPPRTSENARSLRPDRHLSLIAGPLSGQPHDACRSIEVPILPGWVVLPVKTDWLAVFK